LGFNPEFTGRANIYQAGGLLGHSRETLDRLIPEIEAFAELGEFFDKPLRVYSSGMNARLAFSLATAIRPELLIVDEVLSVGDSYFQHKSFARINKFRDEGTSILLVTHSMTDVRTLCQRVMLLDKGEVLKDGLPDEVVDFYNALVAQKQNENMTIEQRRQRDGWLVTRSGTSQTVVKNMTLTDASSKQDIKAARVGQMLRLQIEVEVNADLPVVVLGVWLRDRTGHSIWGTNTSFTEQTVSNLKEGENLTYTLEFPCDLGPGSYAWTIALSSTGTGMYDFEWTDNAIVFDVINVDREFFIGCNRLAGAFTVERPGFPPDVGKRPVLGGVGK
jgi:lipopolysaccharide transport system ATP-binding protein